MSAEGRARRPPPFRRSARALKRAPSVCRSAQGGGDRVAPQPGHAGVWLDLRLRQLAGRRPQDAAGLCLLHPLLQ